MPVTVTVTLPVEVNVHDNVAVPDPPATLVGVRVQAELLLVKATAALKLFNGETVMVEVPADPTTMLTLAGLAAIPKSGAAVTVNETVAV